MMSAGLWHMLHIADAAAYMEVTQAFTNATNAFVAAQVRPFSMQQQLAVTPDLAWERQLPALLHATAASAAAAKLCAGRHLATGRAASPLLFLSPASRQMFDTHMVCQLTKNQQAKQHTGKANPEGMQAQGQR